MGVCCRVWPLISCCGRPPGSESECPWPPSACVCWFYPGALLSPLRPHPCPCPCPCPCPHPHRLTHILPLLCACVGVGDGVLVDSPCPPASPLPCCPAALQPAPHHAAWSGTGQPILCVPSPASPVLLQAGNLARGRDQPSTSSLQPDRIILHPQGSASSVKRQATINKPVGSMSCSPAQPSSLAPVYLHPSLPYHE